MLVDESRCESDMLLNLIKVCVVLFCTLCAQAFLIIVAIERLQQ